ncbi:alanyl aminopeptidase. Metallo peptidase. MEROPS family M01 [Rhizobium sp. RU33A]|uniref:aminopeptidase N n=1 Tax=Rhizobium sp. RU33A TaxID=1907413 RepID=UPI0009571FAB|nr:aminopeptidase N [Rhizobium sp. RU33A]SIQ49475.1 alanyl aminopeptidase. Metallo peptidase. MEROPS family M01 [Rhizobium sp. RU33A]
MRTDTGRIVHLADYRPTDFVLERVDLTFELDPTETKVEARLIFHRREGVDAAAPLVLDGNDLTMTSLLFDQIEMDPSRYTATPESLTIRDLPESTPFEITVVTMINPEANTQLMGLYRSNGIYCTQCEAEGFRRITYFPDRPDVLAVYTINIIADKAANPLLLSNGNFLGGAGFGPDKHFAAWFDPHPKPSYLFALVAGDLGIVEDTFTTMSGREVALKIYVEHGKEPRAAYAMDALKRSMKWDEEVFGREYDLDIFMIVAVSDFNMGAMENKGLNIFNDKYVLADPETATDQDYANIEAIIAHEYFHNWTGNRITCRDWFQLCLKEGLTVYRDHEFSADMRSRSVKRIAEVRHLRSEQFPEDAGPLAHPVRPTKYREINNFYTTTVYEKGSEVTRMIATILGRDDFKKGMDLYFERHDGDAATVEDFVKCFEDASGRDLTQFSLWYHQAGTPQITVSSAYDAGAKTLTLSLEQMIPATPGQSSKEPMHIPLRFALIAENGSEATASSIAGGDVTGDVLHLTERAQTFTFSGITSRPVVSLNRGFSAPVTLHFSQSAEDRGHIARHDSDLFARWQAITDLALPALTDAAKKARDGGSVTTSDAFVGVLLAVAADETLEPAFRAQALTLPSEADIAREIGGNNDPDAIHAGRQAVLLAIATSGTDVFRTLYAAHSASEPFSPDATGAGKRALKNIALSFLTLAENSPALAAEAFGRADNMTDLSQALTILAHRFPDAGETKQALTAFETRFASNALVLDKWFTIQATIPGAGSLDRVKALMASPHFQPTNPNRVRSLIGTFAFSNATGFNRADGAAYAFFAEQILAIDPRNPQLAARLLTAMRSWRLLEPGRGDKARAALASIEGSTTLSTDVRDIVDRILKG